jgi:hypothetical protein
VVGLDRVKRCIGCNQMLIDSVGEKCSNCLTYGTTLKTIKDNYNPIGDDYNLETNEIEWLIEQSEKLQKLFNR